MNDPVWITARYGGRCGECSNGIEEGDRVVWSPDDKKIYCGECGPDLIGEDPRAKAS